MSPQSDPDPGDPEAIRRDMAQALAAIVFSATTSRDDPLFPILDFANRYALEYFGFTLEEVAGDRWIELVHPDDRASVLAAWQASLATGHPYRHEHQLRLADGQYRRFQSQALPLRDEQGAIVKWYGVLTLLEGEPRRRGPRPRAAKVDYYPLRDSAGLIHLVEVALWRDRPDDPAAKLHPDGRWYRLEMVAEAVRLHSDEPTGEEGPPPRP
jgi:PAS domain S-box-containing protein